MAQRSIGPILQAVAFSCAVALAVGEMAARLTLPPPQLVTVEPADDLEERRAQEQGQHLVLGIPTHPEEAKHHFYRTTLAGRRMRANTTATVENHSMSGRRIEIATNSLGYRNREIGPKQGRRILFLGDSITLGAYLPAEETFVRQVERLARDDGLGWETINTGVSGISLKTQLAILHESGLALEPDVVVLGFYLNDFQESPGVYIRSMPWIARRSHLFHYLLRGFYTETDDLYAAAYSDSAEILRQGDDFRVVMPRNLWRMHEEAGRQVERWRAAFVAENGAESAAERAFYDRVIDSFDDWGGAWSPLAWQHFEPLFGELQRLSSERGFAVLVLCFPVRDQVLASEVYDAPQQHLRRLSAELDMDYLDLLPPMREAPDPAGLFYDHCHHTPRGNRLIAEAVYAKLHAR